MPDSLIVDKLFLEKMSCKVKLVLDLLSSNQNLSTKQNYEEVCESK